MDKQVGLVDWDHLHLVVVLDPIIDIDQGEYA